MWTALVRQLMVFLFTRRGRRIVAFVGVLLLFFITALLIDSRMNLTAAFTGAVSVASLIAFVVSHFRYRTRQRDRERRDVEQATRRAAAAQARSERIDKARSTLSGAAKTASHRAAGVAGLAKTGLGEARDRLRFWRRKRKSAVPSVDGRDKQDSMAARRPR
jgi:uncharacterized membrane protein YccC